MTNDQHIIVHIQHEDLLVSAGVRALLSNNSEISIATRDLMNGQVGAEHAGGHSPTVIVTDYEHGLARAQSYRQSRAISSRLWARILIVTSRSLEREIRQALDAGVHGYLVQCCDAEILTAAVRSLSLGVKYFCPLVAQKMADAITRTDLTARESDVLVLLAEGLSNKHIARELDVALGTVKAHVSAVLGKLDADSRTHAVMLATQRGLVSSTVRQARQATRPAANVA